MRIYRKYLRHPDWKKIRAKRLELDNGLCMRCLLNKEGKVPAEDVHHLTYKRVFREELRDLVSLCRSCHSFIHNK